MQKKPQNKFSPMEAGLTAIKLFALTTKTEPAGQYKYTEACWHDLT